MSYTVVYQCDGCGKKLNDDDFSSTQAVLQSKISEVNGQGPHIQEIFCPNCQPHSNEYWDLKLEILQQTAEVMNNRLSKHLKSFFVNRKINDSRDTAGQD